MFKKSGEVTGTQFSTLALTENYETKVMSDGAVFAKIFEHNSTAGAVYFTSVDEVKKCDAVGKFSRLGKLDLYKPTTGKYEFLLMYPDNTTTAYNRWKQTNNPMNEFVAETSAGTGTAAGYEAVSCSWTSNYWGGLTRQLSDATAKPTTTYLSGAVGHSNWFYAIGCMQNYQGGMPAYGNVTTGRAQLWVRIDTLQVNKLNVLKAGSVCAADFIEI